MVWKGLPLSQESFFVRWFPFGADGNEDKRCDRRRKGENHYSGAMDGRTDRLPAHGHVAAFWGARSMTGFE